MLFKQKHLDGIKAGTISLAFRKWRVCRVVSGSLIKTAVGIVRIGRIQQIEESQITAEAALQAGFHTLKSLLNQLRAVPEGTLFQLEVAYESEDPRIALRSRTDLSTAHFNELKNKLEKLDRYSKQGAWTRDVLQIMAENPHTSASEIARLSGHEKEWLKMNIRKLKNLGLTISHLPGYEISPLGKEFMARLNQNPPV